MFLRHSGTTTHRSGATTFLAPLHICLTSYLAVRDLFVSNYLSDLPKTTMKRFTSFLQLFLGLCIAMSSLRHTAMRSSS